VNGEELRLETIGVPDKAEGSPWLREFYGLFAPVREEAKQYSEEEINAAIDDGVKAVRSSKA
jgi:hypothetical protein